MLDDLGDRQKLYESFETERICMPRLPIMARLDGKSFHNFTKGLNRPYDERLTKLMVDTTKFLIEKTHAKLGYTQSDEITLMWYYPEKESNPLFGGKIFKLTSVLSSIATAFFNKNIGNYLTEKSDEYAFFDCRVWVVPNPIEATNVFLWRELDASKNSISMAAHTYFSHQKLQGKSGEEMQEMLFQEHGINWSSFPDLFKRGTFVRRENVVRKFTSEEIDNLPEKHEARTNPNLEVTRTEIKSFCLPRLLSVTNRVEVIFDGETPIISG